MLGGGGTGWESLFCHVFARPPMEAASLRIFFPPCKRRLPISWLIPQRFMDYVPLPWLYLWGLGLPQRTRQMYTGRSHSKAELPNRTF